MNTCACDESPCNYLEWFVCFQNVLKTLLDDFDPYI